MLWILQETPNFSCESNGSIFWWELASHGSLPCRTRSCWVPHRMNYKRFSDYVILNYQCSYQSKTSKRKHTESVNLHPTVITEYLKTELNQNKVANPFALWQSREAILADLEVYQNIMRATSGVYYWMYPFQRININDGVPSNLCSLQ